MKIGIQLAMPSEFRALPGAASLTPFETVSGVDFYRFSPDIIACTGGVGKVNAAMAAEILCLKFGVDLILNAGVAGCFTDLPTTSVVVASDLVQHDVDTTGVGDPIGLVSTVDRVAFPAWQPEHCVELLRRAGIQAVTGRVATSDAFLTRGARSRWVYDTFHPLLAEMEGCAIAQVCLRSGVKFAAVKSVSDHPFFENQAEEYNAFHEALDAAGRAAMALAAALAEEPAPQR